jgi:hypothetical protein
MNIFYLANDTVVISITLFSPERPEKEEGWNLKIVDWGLAGSFNPLFKTV